MLHADLLVRAEDLFVFRKVLRIERKGLLVFEEDLRGFAKDLSVLAEVLHTNRKELFVCGEDLSSFLAALSFFAKDLLVSREGLWSFSPVREVLAKALLLFGNEDPSPLRDRDQE
ncbi:MAG TPA: hypothetical protein VIY73_24350 [Polyangiaceae bacterium]